MNTMQPENLIPADVYCTHHQIEVSFIQSLHEFGLVELTTVEGTQFIPADQLGEVERLKRLHYNLYINMEGLDVVKTLLHQLQSLQQKVTALQAHLRLYEVS